MKPVRAGAPAGNRNHQKHTHGAGREDVNAATIPHAAERTNALTQKKRHCNEDDTNGHAFPAIVAKL